MWHVWLVRNRQLWIWVGVLGIGVGSATIATAQEEAQQIIKNRIAHFREIGSAFKNIRDGLELKQPDVPKIQASAKLIEERGAYILNSFPPGSEPPPPKSWLERILNWFSSDDVFALVIGEAESHAKPVIWTRRSDFEQTYRKFEAEAAKMSQAAQKGQITIMASQFKKLQETCKGCHDVYREELD